MGEGEVSANTKTLAVFLGCLSIFSMCGVVFGMPALYPSLYYRGFWANLCLSTEEQCLTAEREGKCCEAQMVRIGLTSSTTFFMADAAAGLWGEYVDRAGAYKCFSLASLGVIGGFVMLALSLWPSPVFSISRDLLSTISFTILGVAGPGVFNGAYVGCVAIVGSSSSHVSAFTAFSAACFDGSALVFALLRLFGVNFGLGLVTSTLIWSVAIFALRFIFLGLLSSSPGGGGGVELPGGAAQKASNGADAPLPRASEASGLLSSSGPPPALPMPPDPGDEASAKAPLAPSSSSTSSGGGSGFGLPTGLGGVCTARLRSTLLDRVNLAVIALMVSLNLVAAFYLQTQGEQMSLLFAPGEAASLSRFLEFGFPIVGFVASIAAAKLVFEPNHSRELLCWVWPAGLGAAFCLVQSIPLLATQYLAALIFGPMRTMQWACYFHALAVAPRYPQAVAGRVLGYNNVVIALLSDTLPYFLTALTAGDETTTQSEEAWRYAFVRICLLLPVLGSSALLGFELRRAT